MKVLKITMPDDSVWIVPLEVIAKSYIADHDDMSAKDQADFRAGEAIDVQVELLDFGQNNMDWSDVRAKATKVKHPPAVDFQEGWVNGHKEIADWPDPEEPG